MPGEFDIIKKYFAPLAGPEGLSLQDDASIWSVPDRSDLVVTKDVLNEGIHFREEDPPELIAYKAIAVSVSDCISKGAAPTQYWLGLSFPEKPDSAWLEAFSKGLRRAQSEFGCSMSGGDTTKTLGRLAISVTVAGLVPTGKMVKRSGAKVGDFVYITGQLGSAAFGLHCLLNGIDCSPDLVRAYQAPRPPVLFGKQMARVASASADVSDGLIADAGHIASASDVMLEIFKERLPVDQQVRELVNRYPDLENKIWSGGDDYQLLFTAPKEMESEIQEIAGNSKTLVTNIGEVKAGSGVQLLDKNQEIVQVTSGGYEHF